MIRVVIYYLGNVIVLIMVKVKVLSNKMWMLEEVLLEDIV